MKPLTKKWARGALRAVRAIIKKYKKNDERQPCPLCVFTGEDWYGCRSCSICPWVVFKKHSCDGYLRDPIPLRLRRLRGWEKRLMNILKKKRSEK